MGETIGPEQSGASSTDYEALLNGEGEVDLEKARVDAPKPVEAPRTPQDPAEVAQIEAARVPATRDEIRQQITRLRGEAPTDEQLDHIMAAAEDGKYIH